MRKREGIKVLMVDDEAGFLKQAKTFLEKEDPDLQVITETSAREGVKMIEQEDFDVIVSDFQMPEMNGIDFLRVIRKEKQMDIPFIMLTGRGHEEVAKEALNLGADRYLQKTGDPKDQFGILANIIRKEFEKITEEMYRNLLEFSPNATAVISEDMMIEAVNEEFLDLLDKDREDIEGEHISTVIKEKNKNKLEKLHTLKRIDEKSGSSSYYTVVENGSDEEKEAMISLSFLTDSEKCIINIFDLTEWEMNEQLMSQVKSFDIDDTEDLMEILSEKFRGVIDEEKIRADIKRNCLEELVILIIANEEKIHGKAIIDELRDLFGLSISAGTMYPILHDLEERGVLEKHVGIQSKKYSLREGSQGVEIAKEKMKSVFSQYLLLYQLYRTHLYK